MATTCRIVARRNPFDDDIIEAEAPVGFRLAEILSPDGHYHAEANGDIVDWQTYEIRESDELVTVIGLPGEPVSSAVYSFLVAYGSSAAVTAAVAAVTAAVAAVSFVATYGGIIAGAAALVSVATMDTPSFQQAGVPDRLNSLTGTKNRFAPYAPVPVLYGDRRYYPPLAAQPFTELVGQDQYLNMLLMASLGEVDVSDAMIGEAAVNTYDGIEISSHYPAAPAWPVVTDTSVAVQLDDEDWVGTPNVTHTATSDADATALAIDFDFPIGLMYTNSKGERRVARIHFTVEFRVAGSSDPWINVRSLDWRATTKGTNSTLNDADGVPNTPGVGAVVASPRTALTSVGNISGKSGSGLTRTITVPTSTTTVSGGYYEIRVAIGGGQYLQVPATPTSVGPGVTTWIVSQNYARHMSIGMAAQITNTTSGQFMVAQRFGESFRAGLKWPTPAAAAYEIRVTRTFLNQNDDFTNNTPLLAPGTIEYEVAKYQQIMVWSTLHTYTESEAVTLPESIPATFIKVRVKTTDQLTGTLDTLSIRGQRKLRTWNGSAFAGPTLTRSPAWAFLDMIMNPGVNQRGITEADAAAKINLAALKAWHDGTITTEEFSYDEVIDYPVSVYNGLRRAAGVAWAGFSVLDGKFTVIEDKYNTPVQMFSPRNSRGFTATKSFADLPHAIKVQFDSEDADNKTDQLVVYDDGYNAGGDYGTASGRQVNHVGTYSIGTTTIAIDSGTGTIIVGDIITFTGDPHKYRVTTAWASGSLAIASPGLRQTLADNVAVTVQPKAAATKFESLRLPGITNEGHAWKMGRRMIALAKLRPETFSFQTHVEHILCQRGDSVSLLHDVTLWGVGSARIVAKAADTPVGGTTTVTLDETMLTAAATYAMRVRRTTATPPVFDEVTAVPVISSNYNTQWKVTNAQAANWTIGDFVAVGVAGSVTQKAKVLAIRPGAKLTATITCADDTSASATDGVYGAHLGSIAAYTPNVTLPSDPSLIRPARPTITEVLSDPNMAIINPDGSRTVVVSVLYAYGTETDRFANQLSVLRYAVVPEDEEEPVLKYVTKDRADGAMSVPGLEVGLNYQFSVLLIRNGLGSLWSEWFEYEVGDASSTPEPFETLTVNGRPGGFECIVGFPNRDNIGVDYFEILYATANNRTDVSAKTHQFRPVSDLGAVSAVTTFIPVLSPVTQHWFWVRWVDMYGAPSPWLPTSATAGETATNIKLVSQNQGPSVSEDPWFQGPTVGPAGDYSQPWVHASGSSGAAIATITDGVAGVYALQSNTSPQKVVIATAHQPVDLSRTYAVRARVRAQSSCDYGASLIVAFYDSAGTLITASSSGSTGWVGLFTYHVAYTSDPLPSSFTQVSFTFGALGVGSVPAGARTMRVGFMFHLTGTGSTTGEQQVQDLRIDEVLGSVLIEDRAIEASKLKADLILSSLIRTLSSGSRVELEGDASTETGGVGTDFPFWIGTGSKGTTSAGGAGSGARVYYDAVEDEFVITGLLKASKIRATGTDDLAVESTGGLDCVIGSRTGFGGTAAADLTTSYANLGSTLRLYHPGASGSASTRLQSVEQEFTLTTNVFMLNTAGSDRSVSFGVHYDYSATSTFSFAGTNTYTVPANGTLAITLRRRVKAKSSWATDQLDVCFAGRANSGSTGDVKITCSHEWQTMNLGEALSGATLT